MPGSDSSDVGRYFSPQPNVTGEGIVASYGPRFWALVVAIGVGAGAAGAALMELLRGLEHLAWDYRSGGFLEAVKRDAALHRVGVLALAGLVAGIGALLVRRLRGFGGREVSEAVWLEDGEIAAKPALGRGVLSIVIVAFGASLGREAAPQLAGATVASRLADWASVPRWQRQLLVACGAGAGMAAVYNVPLGGALFALEVLLGTLALPLVLPALATSLIATAVAWTVLSTSPTYSLGTYRIHAAQVAWALIVGPLAGLAAVGWVRVIRLAHRVRPADRRGRFLTPLGVLVALGLLAIPYPQLLGNGQDTVQLAITGGLGIGLLCALTVLKPLVTAACLGSGTPGGLFTPTLTFGVLFGGVLGYVWSRLWPGAPAGSYAVIGGAALLAAAMQGPLAAVVLMLELTHHVDSLMVPVLLAVTGATVVARMLGAPSIYSARLDEGAARPREAARAPVPTGPDRRRSSSRS